MTTTFDIVLIRTVSVSADPPVMKIMHSLAKKYDVLVLGWDRENCDSSRIINKCFVKHLKLKCPYSDRMIFFLPLFWGWVLVNLFIYRPRVVHACDLNTAVVGYVYKVLCRRKLVFDVFDRFAMFLSRKFLPIYWIINFLEESLVNLSDACIIVSEELIATFRKWRPKRYTIVMNCPEDVKSSLAVSHREDEGKFNIVYAGLIWRHRGLLEVVKAMEGKRDVRLKIAGRILDPALMNLLLKKPYVEYYGLLSYVEALRLESSADCLIALYDPGLPISQVAMPCKIFDAMMLGIPIITNLVHVIKATRCGILVKYGDIVAIRQAILHLKDHPEIKLKLGFNGRLGFEQEFNWSTMEKRLLEVYSELLPLKGRLCT